MLPRGRDSRRASAQHGGGDVAGLAVGQAHECWQIAIMIEAHMQLCRPLGGLVGGPGENTERQLEEARIQRVELVPEAEAVARGVG